MKRSECLRYRRAIVLGSAVLPDDVAINVPDLFERWRPGTEYTKDQRRSYNGVLYKCLQAHVSQKDWTPDVAVSLWGRVDDPGEEFPEWRQPAGAQDAYAAGAKVSHNEKHWISSVDNNVWEPGVFGWDEVI